MEAGICQLEETRSLGNCTGSCRAEDTYLATSTHEGKPIYKKLFSDGPVLSALDIENC